MNNVWDKFDKIYCIHYLPHTDRVERITNQLKRVGILDHPNFKWKYTFDSPFYQNLLNSDIKLYHDSLKKLSMFKCTLAHYQIYKEAQGLNLNRILILEDDIVFLKDVNQMIRIINNMPQFDVIQFDKWPFSKDLYKLLLEKCRVNNDYAMFARYFSSGAFYSLSKKAINFCINVQEKSLHAGDTAWHNETNENDGINRCFSIKNLGYQKAYDQSYSNNELKNGMINDPMKYFYGMVDLNYDEYN